MNREEFVKEAVAKTKSFSSLCRKYGISRPTGYLWLRRYENGESFSDKSHQTFGTAANKTPQVIEDKIIKARKLEPAIGATKIKRMLKNAGETGIPCMSTINAILKRNDLITQEASANATPYKRFEMPAPNDMWQCDFKGHYGLLDGVRCHPLSVIDDHSRFCLCADAKENEQFPGVKDNNNTRPHHALGLDTPSQHYAPSPRKYCREVRAWEYETGVEVRNLKSTGHFNYKGQGYYFSEGFRGKTIAIKPSETLENAVNIYFREFQVGVIDLTERTIISRKARLINSDKPSDTTA
ncbi:MAG: helix-turn-helix domain-containing protein [Ruminococcus sp.]|jgi:transposase-like protein|nr:helix-turn-helix domain-containing protein [Ruminococcus sp.]